MKTTWLNPMYSFGNMGSLFFLCRAGDLVKRAKQESIKALDLKGNRLPATDHR